MQRRTLASLIRAETADRAREADMEQVQAEMETPHQQVLRKGIMAELLAAEEQGLAAAAARALREKMEIRQERLILVDEVGPGRHRLFLAHLLLTRAEAAAALTTQVPLVQLEALVAAEMAVTEMLAQTSTRPLEQPTPAAAAGVVEMQTRRGRAALVL